VLGSPRATSTKSTNETWKLRGGNGGGTLGEHLRLKRRSRGTHRAATLRRGEKGANQEGQGGVKDTTRVMPREPGVTDAQKKRAARDYAPSIVGVGDIRKSKGKGCSVHANLSGGSRTFPAASRKGGKKNKVGAGYGAWQCSHAGPRLRSL